LPSALHPLLGILLTIERIGNQESVLLKAQFFERDVWWIQIDALDPVKDRLLGHQNDQMTVDRKARIVVHGEAACGKASILALA
jgi:hypothetical protein